MPVPLAGAQLTFVDAILIATFSAVLARVAFSDWRLSPGCNRHCSGAPFVVVAIAAFVVGGTSSSIPPEQIRRFGKLLASVLFFVVATALLTTPDRLTSLTRWLIVAGAVQA